MENLVWTELLREQLVQQFCQARSREETCRLARAMVSLVAMAETHSRLVLATGFCPDTLYNYLLALAKLNNFELDEVLLFLRIAKAELREPALELVPSYARLGRAIGLRRQHLVYYLGVEIANRIGRPVYLNHTTGSFSQLYDVLENSAVGWETDERELFFNLSHKIESAYAEYDVP
jgi:hypothetical protein